jgi:hypothetical protein
MLPPDRKDMNEITSGKNGEATSTKPDAAHYDMETDTRQGYCAHA